MTRTTVRVAKIPNCDFCKPSRKAYADAHIPHIGSWANVCKNCFDDFNCKLGTGRGQEYIENSDKPTLEHKDKKQKVKEHAEALTNDELKGMISDGIVPTACPEGCEVEPDGSCPHGYPSPLIFLGLI